VAVVPGVVNYSSYAFIVIVLVPTDVEAVVVNVNNLLAVL